MANHDSGALGCYNGSTLQLRIPAGITILTAQCRFCGRSSYQTVTEPVVWHPGTPAQDFRADAGISGGGYVNGNTGPSSVSGGGNYPACPSGYTFLGCGGTVSGSFSPADQYAATSFWIDGTSGFLGSAYGYAVSKSWSGGSPGARASFTGGPWSWNSRGNLAIGGVCSTYYRREATAGYYTGGGQYVVETKTGACSVNCNGSVTSIGGGMNNGAWSSYVNMAGLLVGENNQFSFSIGGSGNSYFELYYTYNSNRAFIFPIDNVFGNLVIATDNQTYVSGNRVLVFASEDDPNMFYAFKPINPAVGERAILIPVGGDRYQVVAIRSATEV